MGVSRARVPSPAPTPSPARGRVTPQTISVSVPVSAWAWQQGVNPTEPGRRHEDPDVGPFGTFTSIRARSEESTPFLFLCFRLDTEAQIAHAGLGLKIVIQLRMTLISCLHLPSAGTTGVGHGAWFMRCWASTFRAPFPVFSFVVFVVVD